MKTMKSSRSPTSRITVGNAVLASARTTNSAAVSARIEAFAKLHAKFLAAEEKVTWADEEVRRQLQAVGEADAAQDAAVVTLAGMLAADGLPRANPFKPLGFSSPGAVAKLKYAEEAQEVQRLAKAVLSRSGMSPGTLAAAKALAQAAQAVETQLAPLDKLKEARAIAIRERDTVGMDWEAQLAALKMAARSAEADGARGLYAALFADQALPRARRRKVAPTTSQPKA